MAEPDFKTKLVLFSRILDSIENSLAAQGCSRIVLPTLIGGKFSSHRTCFVIQDGARSYNVSQGSRNLALIAYKAIGSLYTTHKVLRPGPTDRNHLTEFHYIQGITRGGQDVAMKMIEGIVLSAAVGVRMTMDIELSVCRDFSSPLRKVTYSEAVSQLSINPQQKLTLTDQMRIIDHFGGQAIFITELPSSTEPCMVDAKVVDNVPANFDLLVPTAGEVGSGLEIVTGEQARTMAQQGNEAAYEEYFTQLSSIAEPICTWGISIERICQYFLKLGDIAHGVPFPVGVDGHISPFIGHIAP